jgi:uncharacterized protein (DUF427 family)
MSLSWGWLRRRLRRAIAGPGHGERVRAVWNGAVLAESDRPIVIEGNHYFPPEDVDWRYLEPSSRRSACPWKGAASYYTAVVGEGRNEAAAWQYPEPLPAAAPIRDHLAFWRGVRVLAVEADERAA